MEKKVLTKAKANPRNQRNKEAAHIDSALRGGVLQTLVQILFVCELIWLLNLKVTYIFRINDFAHVLLDICSFILYNSPFAHLLFDWCRNCSVIAR